MELTDLLDGKLYHGELATYYKGEGLIYLNSGDGTWRAYDRDRSVKYKTRMDAIRFLFQDGAMPCLKISKSDITSLPSQSFQLIIDRSENVINIHKNHNHRVFAEARKYPKGWTMNILGKNLVLASTFEELMTCLT